MLFFKTMKYFLLLGLMLFIELNAAELRSIQMRGTKLFYYFSASAVPKPGRLVVFIHGGVSQYMNKTISDTVALASLLENNANFIPYCSGDGFDLIILLHIIIITGWTYVIPSGSGEFPLHML